MTPTHHTSSTPSNPFHNASVPARPLIPVRVFDLFEKVKELCLRTQTNGMCFLYKGERIGIIGGDPGTITGTASCTKSLVAMAVFKLVGEGKLDIDQPLYKLLDSKGYEGWQHLARGDWQNITPRHLLTHTSGLPGNEWFLPDDKRWQISGDEQFNNHLANRYDRNLRAAMHPLLYKVGTYADYSNPGTQILAAVVAKSLRDSGDSRTIPAFINEEIFAPLQMNDTSLTEEGGVPMFNGGMGSTAINLAILAECVRQGGSWNDKQIIEKAAVEEMLSTPNHIIGVRQNYAHLWWKLGIAMQPGAKPEYYGFAANGDLNNCAIILPDDEIVIARTQAPPAGPVYKEGTKEFTPAAKEAEEKAFEFWNELVTKDQSILKEFRRSRP